MDRKKSLQFELWEECNNHCNFCYLRNGNSHTDDDLKLKAIDIAISKLTDAHTIRDYNVVSFIGGEFFQGQLKDNDVKKRFFQMMQITSDLLNTRKIGEVWLNASMTTENQEDLFRSLDLFKRHDNIWLCTSYDTIGRFHSQQSLDAWKNTLKRIHERYPAIKTNVSMILTGDLIQKYLDGHFSFSEFKHEWNCQLFLKTPGTGGVTSSILEKKQFNEAILHDFFPTRNSMLKFLVKFLQNEPLCEYEKIYNIEYRADDLYKMTSMNKFDVSHFKRIKTEKMVDYKIIDGLQEQLQLLQCGHRIVYTPYVDSDCCFLCDKENIKKIMQ